MEQKRAELFEPAGRVFGSRVMSLRATVARHFERWYAPGQLQYFLAQNVFRLIGVMLGLIHVFTYNCSVMGNCQSC